MTASNKLSTAVKALCYLAQVFPDAKTSGEIAENISVNASKLRLILSALNKNEIIFSSKGINGGFVLQQDFTSLTLFQIYDALDDRKIIDLDVAENKNKSDYFPECYNQYFSHLFLDMQQMIEGRMKEIKLNEIKENVDNDIKKVIGL